MFIDQAQIYIKAGKGGNGIVSFRREKYVPDGGPDGGDGGRGGSVIAIVDEGMKTLMDFRYKTKYYAEDGVNGKKKKMAGKNADDLILRVPPGTIIRDLETGGVIADLTEKDQKAVLVKGGKGGRGNPHFTTSTRQAPTFAEPGTYGQERTVVFELKMLADVGLVGFPNVGKSTMLSVLTKAKPKIANYHFTTLKPNLGVVEIIKGKSFVLADIPGLIEGAAEGVGLGHDFLRHVERTKLLVHVVDISGVEGRDPIQDFDQINGELTKYSPKLALREMVVAANKMDLLADDEVYDKFVEELKGRGYTVFPISAATQEGVNDLMLYVTERMDHIEDIPLVDEADLYVVHELKEDKNKEIQYRIEDDVYIVDGVPIERIVYSTDFDNVESLRHFEGQLRKRGVFAHLKELGINNGDTVRIFDFEFEFYD